MYSVYIALNIVITLFYGYMYIYIHEVISIFNAIIIKLLFSNFLYVKNKAFCENFCLKLSCCSETDFRL